MVGARPEVIQAALDVEVAAREQDVVQHRRAGERGERGRQELHLTVSIVAVALDDHPRAVSHRRDRAEGVGVVEDVRGRSGRRAAPRQDLILPPAVQVAGHQVVLPVALLDQPLAIVHIMGLQAVHAFRDAPAEGVVAIARLAVEAAQGRHQTIQEVIAVLPALLRGKHLGLEVPQEVVMKGARPPGAAELSVFVHGVDRLVVGRRVLLARPPVPRAVQRVLLGGGGGADQIPRLAQGPFPARAQAVYRVIA